MAYNTRDYVIYPRCDIACYIAPPWQDPMAQLQFKFRVIIIFKLNHSKGL